MWTSDDEGLSLLHNAVQKGRREVAKALIKAGCDVDKVKDKVVAPIYAAAEKMQMKGVESLIKAGCDMFNTINPYTPSS